MEAFTARQMFHAQGQGRGVPSFLLFASADDRRTISFNEEIHRLFFGSRMVCHSTKVILLGLYSATVNRFEYDSEGTGFRLLTTESCRRGWS
jgi:hypothetical protein